MKSTSSFPRSEVQCCYLLSVNYFAFLRVLRVLRVLCGEKCRLGPRMSKANSRVPTPQNRRAHLRT